MKLANLQPALLLVTAILLMRSGRSLAGDPPPEMFLTRAESAEFTIKGKKEKRWAPTDEKIQFAWSDQPFAVHIPYDLRSKVQAGRPRPGDGAIDAVTVSESTIRLHLRGFSAPGIAGMVNAPVIGAGVYRLDGAPPHQEDAAARFHFVEHQSGAPPNLDIPPRTAAYPPQVVNLSFRPTGQTRYVYWIVLDPRSRRIPDTETRYFGDQVHGVSPDFWAKQGECKGTVHAAIEGEGTPAAREAKLEVAIIQNRWEISRVKEELRGNWKQEIDKGWTLKDLKTQWKDSVLTSVHQLNSAQGKKEVTLALQLPSILHDNQPCAGTWRITQSDEVRNPPVPKFGLMSFEPFGALRVYAYREDPKVPEESFRAGPNFIAGKDSHLGLTTNEGRNVEGAIKLDALRPGTLPAHWTADRETREYRLMSLDLFFITAAEPRPHQSAFFSPNKKRPIDAPVKHIDIFAKRVSETRDNRIGRATAVNTAVLAAPDDGYHDWTVRFEELRHGHMSRVHAIVLELEALKAMRDGKRRQWLRLWKLDQLSFPDESDDMIDAALRSVKNIDVLQVFRTENQSAAAARLQVLQHTTFARLRQMKQQRDELRAEMNAIQPKQEELIAEGARLMKQLVESVEGQIIASRDVYPRPQLKEDLIEFRLLLGRSRLTMYYAAGLFGPDGFEKVAREYQNDDPEISEWGAYLNAMIALARADQLEEKLAVMYAMPHKPAPGNPIQAEAGRERIKAMNSLREAVRLKPDHAGARQALLAMELRYLNTISAKLSSEQRMTLNAFKSYLTARGYFPDKPEEWYWQTYEVASVTFGHSFTHIWASLNGDRPKSTPSLMAGLPGDIAVDHHEQRTSRLMADIAKYHVSVSLIRSLVRNGMPMAKIRNLTPDQLEEFFRMHSAAGTPLDKEKIRRHCDDLRETFNHLPDLRALANGDVTELDDLINRAHFEMLDPSKSWIEAGGDFFFSGKSIMLFGLGGSTVYGKSVSQLLSKSPPMRWVAEKLASTDGGRYVLKAFADDLQAYNLYSKGRTIARGAASLSASLLAYYYLSTVVQDVPVLRELVDLLSAMGPFEASYEALAHSGVSLAKLEQSFQKADQLILKSKAQLAEHAQAIEELENGVKTVSNADKNKTKLKPKNENIVSIDRILKDEQEKLKTLNDPSLRPKAKMRQAIAAAQAALKNGELEEVTRALKAAREFHRQLEAGLREFETKLKDARELLARFGPPRLAHLQQSPSPIVGKTEPTPFIPVEGYPMGEHGDFVRLGDLAFIRGDFAKAGEFYQAAYHAKRINNLPDPGELVLARQRLAAQTLKAFEDNAAKRANALLNGSREMITEEQFLKDLASGELRLKPMGEYEKGVNTNYRVLDKKGDVVYYFKTPENLGEINLEAISTAALEGTKAQVEKGGSAALRNTTVTPCRAIRKGEMVTFHDGSTKALFELKAIGILSRAHVGKELFDCTEAQLFALKKDLAEHRVLRLWLGDIDGNVRNMRLGEIDGKLCPIDFGYAHLSDNAIHDVYWAFNENLKATKFPRAKDPAQFLEMVMLAPDLLKDVRDHQFRAWMRRIDEVLNYDDMEGAVNAIRELCQAEDGNRLRKCLEAAGVQQAELETAVKVLRERAEVLEGVLQKRFLRLKTGPVSPRSALPLRTNPFDLPAFVVAA